MVAMQRTPLRSDASAEAVSNLCSNCIKIADDGER